MYLSYKKFMENIKIITIIIIFTILVFILIKKLAELNKIKKELDKLTFRFKDLINVDLEKEKVINEKNEISNWIDNEKNKIYIWAEEQKEKIIGELLKNKKDTEKEISDLKNSIIEEKEKSLKLINYREKLQKEISLLEEDQELQEFGFYKPKYFYETSEGYKTEIQKINEKQKYLIKEKKAAICTTEWQVNGSKTEGAKQTRNTLKLMLRAFNGEADSAIAKVKYNNIKVMENRIIKAYEAVNKLNETNRSYITKEYLDLKIKELELNYEMAEKIQQEKEEQRRIKEQMREEEKAQREFEKAKEEAAKEEERSKIALQKAEEKLKNAHGEQLNKLNAQIERLKADLLQAQQNKERAISMAQLTKSGHVYIISNIGSFGENIYKIGMTRRLEPMDRVRELGDASVPFNFDVHAMIFSENAPELETALHKEFYNDRVNKINDKREFFRVNLKDIKAAVEKYGAKAEFTMLAQAEQYRQTLALENENKNKEKIIKEKELNLQNEKEYILNI